MYKYKDTYFTIVDKSYLDFKVRDELLKVLPNDVVIKLMNDLGYVNGYILKDSVQICRELKDGKFCISVQLCPNLPPYKDFYNNKNVAEYLTFEQYQIAVMMYEEKNIFNQDVFKTLEFKETIT